MAVSLQIEGPRNVKLQCDVDRTLARRLDTTAKLHGVTRAAVIRAALQKVLPADQA